MNPMKDVGVAETRSWLAKVKSAGAIIPSKKSNPNSKPHAYLHIIDRKSTKFQMNPMKDVGGVAETRSWLAKFKSAWAITPSNKNSKTTCTSSYHKKKSYISSESDERCRRGCGDKISRTEGRTDGRTDGRNNAHTDGRGSFL